MTAAPKGDVTQLLTQMSAGDETAAHRLMAIVYDELRATAGGLMSYERQDHTLQPTALVHEAAARLIGDAAFDGVSDRRHFFAIMATAMRRILIDHARSRNAQRRGGEQRRMPLDAAVELVESQNRVNLIELDEALSRLQAMSPRQFQIVEMRFFGGFEMAEIAELLDVSLSTVEKDWRVAKAWLAGQLRESK